MTPTIHSNKKIIIDADVIIHFINGDQLGILHTIFPNEIYILDVVFNEVFKGRLRTQVENLIRFGFVKELEFDGDINVAREFARLKRSYGAGESACMAFCRYNEDVLASSNLADIKEYCTEHNIQYLTTMDFLQEAFRLSILSETDCDTFISNVLSKGSKLPCSSLRQYLRNQ